MVLAAVLLWPAAAGAQTTAAPPAGGQVAPGQASPTGPVLSVSRDEAIRLAVANNPDLAAERLTPQISAELAAAARGVFVPTLQTGVVRNSQSLPPTSLFAGAQGQETDFWSTNVAVTQLLPVGGGSYSVGWDSARTTTNSIISTFDPSTDGQLQFGFSQPLWRDFRIDPLRAQVEITERNRTIADAVLREQLVRTTSQAEGAYWALVASRAQVTVQQQALDLALELERTNRARVDVGQSPPLDLVAAQAEVAQRRENLIVAQTTARRAEDVVRTLIVDPARSDYWSLRIEATDRVPGVAPPLNVDAAIQRTLAERADITRAKQEIANIETVERLAENQTKPDVRLEASYLAAGAGGTRLIREGGFPGTVVGTDTIGFGDVLQQVFTQDYPTWNVGVTFSYPLGKSTAEAERARARLDRQQAAARLRSLELTAVRQVRDAASRVEQNEQRLATTRLARELAEQRLDAEQRRFEVGMSTSFLVIQAQRDLAIARDNELQAQLDYRLALVAYETVQTAGPIQLTTSGGQ
jgi:outer membrane protein TolC